MQGGALLDVGNGCGGSQLQCAMPSIFRSFPRKRQSSGGVQKSWVPAFAFAATSETRQCPAMAADDGEVGVAGAGLVDDLAVEHYHQTVGEFQKLVEISLTSSTAAPRLRAAMISAWICATAAKSRPKHGLAATADERLSLIRIGHSSAVPSVTRDSSGAF
jgi:hypothetical protein